MRPRVGELKLAEILGSWSTGTGALYSQLADALRGAIDRGDLRPGTVLPPERGIARGLVVSRTTVVAALETLKRIGYLDSKPGSGTWVRPLREFPLAGGVTAPATSIGRNPLFRQLGREEPKLVDFTAAVVGASPLVAETFQEALASMRHQLDGAGFYPLGLPSLREVVAERFTERGLTTSADEVMITAGAQQAIMLLAAAYIQPGDPVLVETPTFPGALEAFRLVGAVIRTVDVGSSGLMAADVLRSVEARPPKVAYLIPSFHNPTGSVMGTIERRRLLDGLTASGTVVVEDEASVELALGASSVPPPLHVLAKQPDSTLVIGSASKPYWGGLRVGWIRAPGDVIEMLSRHKLVFDLATAVPSQVAAETLLRRREVILAGRRRELTHQRETLLDGLASELPDWTVTPPSGGLMTWVHLAGASATEFSQLALRHGVALVAGPFFDPHGRHDSHIRLPYVADPEVISEGVERLATAWQAMRRRPLGDTA